MIKGVAKMDKGAITQSLVLAISLALSACTIRLPDVVAPPGVSSLHLQTDISACKDRAELEAQSTGEKVLAVALGASIVGAPAGYSMERSALRSAYAKCMSSRGYTVMDF